MSNQSVSRVCSILALCIAVWSLEGCGGSQQPPPPAAPPPAPLMAPPASVPVASAPVAPAAPGPAEAPPAASAKRKVGQLMLHPAVAMLLADVKQVGLRPEQQASVDAIQTDLEKQVDTLREPRAQFSRDLADGVAAGKLDKSKLDADSKRLAEAAESNVKTVQDAANRLHATLDATQRKALVELMRQKGNQMQASAMRQMHGPANNAPGSGPNDGEHPGMSHADHHSGAHEMGAAGAHTHMGIDRLSDILALSQEQRETLRMKAETRMKAQMSAMKNVHAAMQKRIKNIADAFISDKFDAKKAGVGEKHADMMKNMMKARIEFVETVLSVVTQEQRAKFADHIRQHCELCDEEE